MCTEGVGHPASPQLASPLGKKHIGVGLFSNAMSSRSLADEVEGRTHIPDINRVKQKLAAGVSVDSKSYGWAALHHASGNNDTESMRLLINARATLDMRNVRGYTPLICAALGGSTEAARMLLEEGADITLKRSGKSAVEYAIEGGHDKLAAELAVELGTALDARAAATAGTSSCYAPAPARPAPAVSPCPEHLMRELHDELLAMILELAPALAARRAASVCRRWRALVQPLNTSLALVTEGGTNELVLLDARGRVEQRLKALPPRKPRHARGTSRGLGGGSRRGGGSAWPTAMALTPSGDLLVSQYKVHGLLLFRRTLDGFKYQRTVISSPKLESPEGVVCAHGSIYLASVESGRVTRLTPEGRVLSETLPQLDSMVFCTLWGMCKHGDRLYLAAHRSEGGFYDEPTSSNTGFVAKFELSDEGDFSGLDHEGLPIAAGGAPALEPFSYGRVLGRRLVFGDSAPLIRLNRPSDPSICPHGFLHVSSFVSRAEGSRRRIYKMATTQCALPGHPSMPHEQAGRILGWLEADEASAHLLQAPWGLSFAADGSLHVTSHACDPSAAAPSGVIRLQSCGCAMFAASAPRAGSAGFPADRTDFWLIGGHAIRCGVATELTTELMQEPNYVLSGL